MDSINESGPAELREKVKEIALEAGKIASLQMVTECAVREAPVNVNAQWIAESACYQFLLTLGVPVARAKYHEVIAEWPATLWDHVKCCLGMRYAKERVTYTEVVAFPDLIGDWSEKMRERARVFQETHSYVVGAKDNDAE